MRLGRRGIIGTEHAIRQRGEIAQVDVPVTIAITGHGCELPRLVVVVTPE